jgi:hypothetical protein
LPPSQGRVFRAKMPMRKEGIEKSSLSLGMNRAFSDGVWCTTNPWDAAPG